MSTALTGAQKVAVVLMNMDQQRAAQVMKQFSDEEADEITAEILRLRRVDPGVAEKALNEFHDLATRGAVTTRGGRDIAVGLLEASFGAERATGVLNRVASNLAGKQFEFLDAVEPAQVQMLLAGELPQTSALVLAHLRADHASRVLAGLDDTARTEVAHAIATMGSPSPDAVRVVAETLKQRASAVVSSRAASDAVGGVQPLVDIINRSDAATEKALLEALEQRDPQLAEEVRSRMLTFDDIVRLESRDVQQVLRGVDAAVLAVAMKGASEAVSEVITTNLSERNREILEDEVRILGPVRVSQVEDARAEIVRAIRDLEATGAITVQRGDEDAYVE
ncbi:flagellar motor switch protein FliG [Leifsonia sp. 98AMF]|uniref:flagellar motor switch protein FliG n=1 Tax=unclassified Leifsonia TaxID=2663824 RepID=UPI00037D7DB5|nr:MULTISPECIES: flagellar motor switch protein FliG [unclassified Leifsonia]TDQ01781.1 flagellar motor switch protein FliG [Leifsonia sp. 115AMFTsu3.1]SDG97034.1 flagellar motor switch protein FliG [Leifsonia sp. 197AMF]SDJ44449.1 flagellar motor switch protein FliG [Leifsonia sp. 466MF]SDK31855.1 flagellar motor switch protein FliG [Leifsonia sp. 157MF]SDN64754.1 flagellar motor switch protein FliG [Leifsonia sp. 509MF]